MGHFFLSGCLIFFIGLPTIPIGKAAPPHKHQSVLLARQLEKDIYQFFQNRRPPEIEKFTIEINNLPDSILIPQPQYQLGMQLLNGQKFKGSVLLQVEIKTGLKIFKKFVFRVKVAAFEKVVVAGKTFSRHTEITLPDVRIESRETTNLNPDLFYSPEKVVGFRTRCQITEGSVLTAEKIEPVPWVNRGEEVTLLITMENLFITTRGKALADGGKNDIILVQNLASQKKLKGEVIAPQQVLITP